MQYSKLDMPALHEICDNAPEFLFASQRQECARNVQPPLGYDAKDRKLVVNEAEAETVRFIFKRYLELGSVKKLCDEVGGLGIRSKLRRHEDGITYGGMLLARGAMNYLLQNQIYLGKIVHKEAYFDGQHKPIVSNELFGAIQHHLKVQGPGEAAKRKLASPAILKGLVFDGAGNRLQPTHSSKHGRKYRYYVSASIIRDAKSGKDGLHVPAPDLEGLIIRSLSNHLRDRLWLASVVNAGANLRSFEEITSNAAEMAKEIEQLPIKNTGLLNKIIDRIEVQKSSVRIFTALASFRNILGLQDDSSADQSDHKIEIPGHIIRCGKEVRFIIGSDQGKESRIDNRLLREIVQARKWFAELAAGKAAGIADLARRSNISAAHVSRRITLAFLAPDITEMIMVGTQPISLTPERLGRACPLPMSWEDQRAVLLT